MRDLHLIDILDLRQIGDMCVVGPVAEGREIAVRSTLPSVLSGGLPMHLEDPRARLAQHAPDNVHVVDLHGCCGGLMRLVKTLQHGGQQPLCVTQNPRRFTDERGRHTTDVGDRSGGYSSTCLTSSS